MKPPLVNIPNLLKMTQISEISESPRINLKDLTLNVLSVHILAQLLEA